MRAFARVPWLIAACVALPIPAAQGAAPEHDAAPDEHAHHQHHMMMPGMAAESTAPADTPGTASAPEPPKDHAADAFFPLERMAPARKLLMHEGRMTYSQVLLERLEVRSRSGWSGLAWEGEASSGTDIDRFVLTSEGEGEFGERIEKGEVQAKWRHAIGPWFNAELGLRQDLTGPARTYLSAGIEGLLPYWIESSAQVFVSHKGDAHARLELETDQRITQRLVLQPSAEIEVAFQDVPELGITSRVPEWSLGARLRYEIQPYFAPYIGVERRRDHAQPREPSVPRDGTMTGGHGGTSTNLLIGLRAWF